MSKKQNTPELRVGVKAFIKNEEGKYLLVKRSAIRYAFMRGRLRWEISGGRMEPGFIIKQNLAREIKKEVGLDIVDDIILLDAQDIMYFHGHAKQVVRLSFLVNCLSSEVILDTAELSDFKWVTKEELENEELDEYTGETLKKIKHLL